MESGSPERVESAWLYAAHIDNMTCQTSISIEGSAIEKTTCRWNGIVSEEM